MHVSDDMWQNLCEVFLLGYDATPDELLAKIYQYMNSTGLYHHNGIVPRIVMQDLPEDRTMFTLEEFIEDCKQGSFIDYDGFGYYATEDQMSNIAVRPSGIKAGAIREGYTHVVWFNR